MRYAICYVSTAKENLSKIQLDNIMKKTEEHNNSHNIKGVMLYSDGNFFQVLEGEKEQVQELFNKIKKDPRHQNVISIFGKEVQQTSFDHYEVDFISESTKYNPKPVEVYLETIKALDKKSQRAVKKILEVFLQAPG